MEFPLFFLKVAFFFFFGFLILWYLTYDRITGRGNMGGSISHCFLHPHVVMRLIHIGSIVIKWFIEHLKWDSNMRWFIFLLSLF